MVPHHGMQKHNNDRAEGEGAWARLGGRLECKPPAHKSPSPHTTGDTHRNSDAHQEQEGVTEQGGSGVPAQSAGV